MKIVCISDTHNRHYDIPMPEGDMLICAGDFTVQGGMVEVLGFNRWLGNQPYRHKIVIAGNHDRGFEQDPETFRDLLTNAIYLENSGIEIEGLKIWGSPVTPWNHCMAFNEQEPEKLLQLWAQIPEGLDILITHGPPSSVLDTAIDGSAAGCQALLERVVELGMSSKAPRLHVFGHHHPGAGHKMTDWGSDHQTLFVNACQLDEHNQPHGDVFVVDLEASS